MIDGIFIGDKSIVNSGSETAKSHTPSRQLKNTARIKK